MSSLAEAIIYDSESSVVAKIAAEAFDVNEFDRFGFRPLIEAIICKKPDILMALLEHGADIEQQDALGRTPLQWACDQGEIEFCKILLEQGADPNHYSLDGQPVLVNPILREELSMVELLLDYGADQTFPQDFISAKLLGHRFELTGEADIIDPQGSFIPLSFEGFYLEFTANLLQRSLYNFINSIPGQKFNHFQAKLNKISKALKDAAKLSEFGRHKDKTPFDPIIDAILDNELLLIPSAFEGHAITFIKYQNFWAKCDRGVDKHVDTVIISEIGNPYALTKSFIKNLLYGAKTREYIEQEIKQELSLKTFKTLPTKSQLSGNCSWANVETSVPAMLYLISLESIEGDLRARAGVQRGVYKFYSAWLDWDKDSALDEVIEDLHHASHPRQLSKAMMLSTILVQRCNVVNKKELTRAKKILAILTEPNFRFTLENIRRIYCNAISKDIGKNIQALFEQCGLDLKTLTLKGKATSINHKHKRQLIKMTTALHVAALTGQLEAAKYLVEKMKLDPNYLDRTGSTALMYAAWRGHMPLVAFLVNAGADIQIKNLKNGTAIRYAIYAGHKEIAEFLKNQTNV